MVPPLNLKFLMETECLLQVFIRPDESLIIFVPAVHTGYSIIKAWGYVLIILLNSDEILKRSPLGSHHQQMKQSFAQLVSSGSHVFLHLFRIFQFEAQQAKSGIKDLEKEGGKICNNNQTPPLPVCSERESTFLVIKPGSILLFLLVAVVMLLRKVVLCHEPVHSLCALGLIFTCNLFLSPHWF